MVDDKRFELSTSAMRTQRSPNEDGKQSLSPEDTICVHITSYKMNRKAMKFDFCAEYPAI